MENFYREGRKRFDVLMDGKDPIGGQWNYDKENRQTPPKGKLETPSPHWFEPDAVTQSVIERVEALEIPTFGGSHSLFRWAGHPQAGAAGAGLLHRSSSGNLRSLSGCDGGWRRNHVARPAVSLPQPGAFAAAGSESRRVEQEFHENDVPLNSVEGFIRQVMGWREYMRGLYTYFDEDYPQKNWFNHQQPLPDFFWSGDVEMNCLHQVIDQVRRTGYGHHIQRLMILSNFALIAGYNPPGSRRLVPCGLYRRLRLGDANQRHWHGSICRWRAAGLQALCVIRQLRQ